MHGPHLTGRSDAISTNLRLQAAALRQPPVPPSYGPMPLRPSDEEMARRAAKQEADRAARQAYVERRLAAAMAAWESLRAAVPAGPISAVVLAVLDLHKPYLRDSDLYCEECDQVVYGGDVEWPCDTYEAIREGLKGLT